MAEKKEGGGFAVFRAAESWVCNVIIILLAVIPVIESFLRVTFHRGIPYSQTFSCHLLLVIGCVAGMITTSKKEHLSIGLINYLKNEALKTKLAAITNLLSAAVSVVLFFCSIVYIKISLNPPQMIGFIPEWVFALALPVGFAVMAARFAFAAPLRRGRAAVLAVIFAVALTASFPIIAKFIWAFNLPDWAAALNDRYAGIAAVTTAPVIALLVILAFAGTPLFIILGTLSLFLFEGASWEPDSVIINMSSALTTNDFIAIPLFSLVGFFLSESKAGVRLVEAFKSLFGWFPGGMIAATALICAFFTTFTGASGVTILALGGILFTVLAQNGGYSGRFSRGILTASGSIGILFPPSLPLILVGLTMQQSVKKFFAAGAFPGLILIVAMIIFGIISSIKTKIPLETFSLKKAARAIKNAFFEILLPILLVTGYFSGILSLSEIGAAALVYIIIVEVFIIRDLKVSDIPKVFAKALPVIGGILMVIALSRALSDYIVFTQAPQNFARMLRETISSPWVFLLLLNAALLLAGCFMDIFSATVVILPLIVPLGAAYNIDPLHLGIIFLINLEAGYLTPPVGLNLLLASYRFKKPFVEICRDVFPFLLIQLAVVLLVTYVPALSTWLPQFF